MKFLIVLASVVLVINASTDRELWLEFKQNHARNYRNLKEEQVRFSIFENNLRTIEKHNELYASGEKSYHMGINKFSDMTPEEFKSMLNNSSLAKPAREGPIVWHQESGVEAASSINWGNQGVVTGIKDQGQCGSCWAFSATGAVEGAYAIKHGELISFSEQNLVDCCTKNWACDGGYMQTAFDYIRDNGIEKESDYPYTAAQGSCQFQRARSVTTVSQFVSIAQSESSLVDAVSSVGPIAVSINADHFQHYAGGIFNEPSCDDVTDHGVLITGYGKASGYDYWMVKNSWGATWGENGYVRMVRNQNNQCGIANDGSYPVL